jgi:hypothetical protein
MFTLLVCTGHIRLVGPTGYCYRNSLDNPVVSDPMLLMYN